MPLWTPAIISPHTWIDFSDSSTLFDATSGGSVVTNGIGIARAEDKSGNGRHFTQSTSGNRFTWTSGVQNGLGVARGDGGDCLTANTANDFAFFHQAAGCVFLVASIGTSSNPNTVYDLIGNNGASVNNQGFFFRYDDRAAFSRNNALTSGARNSLSGGSGDDFYFSGSNDVATANTMLILQLQTDMQNATASAKLRKRVDGGSDFGNNTTTRNPSTANPTFALQLGASGNNALTMVGDFCEVVIFNSLLSSTNRQLMEGYLAWKWGVQANLPGGHPHKNAAPFYGSDRRRRYSGRAGL
jgi:hypothetical protein